MPTALSAGKVHSIRRRWLKILHVVRQALLKFLAEDSLMVSASIAYHSLLAIFPLLLLLLGVSGIYIRHFELAGHLSVVLQRYLPIRSDIIMQNLVGISRAYGRTSLVSFALLLWSSSGVFLPLEKALNRAWEVGEGRPWWHSRLLALEMAAVVGCLILIAGGFVGVEIIFRQRLRVLLGPSLNFVSVFLYHFLTAISSFAVALLTFVFLFDRLPNRPMNLRQILPGALLTAILWEAARWLFTILLPVFNYRHIYGSIGVMVALMTWVYISSAVMLFGAQISRSLYGSLRINEARIGTATSEITPDSLEW
ncbi:MAG: YihY/virulence factor BrkB family protein [Terriglobia bacterium]